MTITKRILRLAGLLLALYAIAAAYEVWKLATTRLDVVPHFIIRILVSHGL